ncbi:hypothetical protein V6N13_100478 [Hibiscus sabdariffa]
MQDKPTSTPQDSTWNNTVETVMHGSLKSNVATLLTWLKKEKFKKIGIRGHPGLGKTTTMKTVQHKITTSGGFDIIFYASVTTGTNLSQFGHDKSNRDPWIAKYLLFLDDVPSEVKVEDLLEKAGIDLSKTDGQVVFACRDKYDCKTDEDMYIKAILECSVFSKEGSRFPSDF